MSAATGPGERELAVAVAVGRRLGLPVEAPAVLHAGSRAVVSLAPAPVVARVARLAARARPRAGEALSREVAYAGWLAAHGAPVLPPTSLVPAGPHASDGCVLSLWPHVDLAPGAGAHVAGQPRAFAAALAALHQVAQAYPAHRLPGLSAVVEDAAGALAAGGAWLPVALRDGLEARRADAELTASAADGVAGRPLHGDAHPHNLLRVSGSALWCDLEDAVFGPVEWDLAAAVHAATHDGAAAVEAYTELTGTTPDGELLAALVALRAWQVDCWQVLLGLGRPGRRNAVLARLTTRA